MKLSKPLGLIAIVGMLIPGPAALASQGNGKSGTPKAEKSEKADKDKKDKNPVHSVPEPATIALLGAAAGLAGARKLWQKRRSRSA
jgi:PEP-CTERM motif